MALDLILMFSFGLLAGGLIQWVSKTKPPQVTPPDQPSVDLAAKGFSDGWIRLRTRSRHPSYLLGYYLAVDLRTRRGTQRR
jgi:hypothetical protein